MDQYERVLLRLVGAEDDQLSPVVYKLLPIVLNKFLIETDKQCVGKIVEILNHILQRVKANKDLYLPIIDIITILADKERIAKSAPSASIMIYNLGIIFLQLGVERFNLIPQAFLDPILNPEGAEKKENETKRDSSSSSTGQNSAPSKQIVDFVKGSSVAADLIGRLLVNFHKFPKPQQPQVFLSVLHAVSCFYPSQTVIASLVFGSRTTMKEGLFQIPHIQYFHSPAEGSETKVEDMVFDNEGVRAFLDNAVEFMLIPGNALDVKPPAIAGMGANLWQVWKTKLDKLSPKIGSIITAKMLILQFIELSAPQKIERTLLKNSKLGALPQGTPGEAKSTGSVEKSEETIERSDLALLESFRELVCRMYAVYTIGSMDQYETVSMKGEILAKRLDHKLEGFAVDDSDLHNALFEFLIGLATTNSSAKYRLRVLQFIRERIAGVAPDSIAIAIDQKSFRERMKKLDDEATSVSSTSEDDSGVNFAKFWTADTPEFTLKHVIVTFLRESITQISQVQNSALQTILHVADHLFSAYQMSEELQEWLEGQNSTTQKEPPNPQGDGQAQQTEKSAADDKKKQLEKADFDMKEGKRLIAVQHILNLLERTFLPTAIIDPSLSEGLRLAFRTYGKLTRKQMRNAREALRVAPKLFSLLDANPDASEEILEALQGVLLWFSESTSKKESASSCATATARRGVCSALIEHLSDHPKPLLRREALRWVMYLFEPESAEYRFYAIKMATDADAEVASNATKAMEISRRCPTLEAMITFLVENVKLLPSQAGGSSNGAACVDGINSSIACYDSTDSFNPENVPVVTKLSKRSLGVLVEFLVTECMSTQVSEEDEMFDNNSSADEPDLKRQRRSDAAETNPQISLNHAVFLLLLADISQSLRAYLVVWKLAAWHLERRFQLRMQFFVSQILLSKDVIGWAKLVQQVVERTEFNERKQLFTDIYGRYFSSSNTAPGVVKQAACDDRELTDTVCLILAVLTRDFDTEGVKVLEQMNGRLDSTKILTGATLLVQMFSSETVLPRLSDGSSGSKSEPNGADSTSTSDASAKFDTSKVITDNSLRLGGVGNESRFREEYAFSAIRFLGVCGDSERILQIASWDNWNDRDDAICAVALALVVDLELGVEDLLEITRKCGISIFGVVQEAASPTDPKSPATLLPSATTSVPAIPIRHAIIWIACCLKHSNISHFGKSNSTIMQKNETALRVPETVEKLTRMFMVGLSDMRSSLFLSDVSSKALVRLYALTNVLRQKDGLEVIQYNDAERPDDTPAEEKKTEADAETTGGSGQAADDSTERKLRIMNIGRPMITTNSVVVKTIFAQLQQRSHVDNAFVAKKKIKIDDKTLYEDSKDSVLLAAKDRQLELVEILFMCRQLGNMDFIMAVFDQPSGTATASNMDLSTENSSNRVQMNEMAARLINLAGASGDQGLLSNVVGTLKKMMSASQEAEKQKKDAVAAAQRGAVERIGDTYSSNSEGLITKALDVRNFVLPVKFRQKVAPKSMLPKFPVFFFHSTGKLREVATAVCANYYGVERVQEVGPWKSVYETLVDSMLQHPKIGMREAACRCATQLVRGRTWRELSSRWKKLWEAVISLIDDIEPRIEAVSGPLSRSMRALTIRLCNSRGKNFALDGPKTATGTASGGAGSSSGGSLGNMEGPSDVKTYSSPLDVQSALKETLPMLLEFIQLYKFAHNLCFDIIQEIAEMSNPVLFTPFLLDLVPLLLESLNALENYKVAEYQWDFNRAGMGERYEQARIGASKDSASFALLRKLVPSFDTRVLETLQPKLRGLLRGGVGSNTRSGVCDLYTMIVMEKPEILTQSFILSTLKALAGSLLDPSIAVKSSAASSFATMSKRIENKEDLAVIIERKLLSTEKDDSALNKRASEARLSLGSEEMISKAMGYFQDAVDGGTGDQGFLEASAKALSEIHRRGCDLRSIGVRDKLVAKAFFHRFSKQERIQTQWKQLWTEIGFSVQSNAESITGMLIAAFKSQERATRMQASEAALMLAKDLNLESMHEDDAPHMAKILYTLQGAIGQSLTDYTIHFQGSAVVVDSLITMRLQLHGYYNKREKEGKMKEENAERITQKRLGSQDLQMILDIFFKTSTTNADRITALNSLEKLLRGGELYGYLGYGKVEDIYQKVCDLLEEKEKELMDEAERDFAFISKIRGKSSAEDLLLPVFEVWTMLIEKGKENTETDADLSAPASIEKYTKSWIYEYKSGSGNLKVVILRCMRRVVRQIGVLSTPFFDKLPKDVFDTLLEVVYVTGSDDRSRVRKAGLDLMETFSKIPQLKAVFDYEKLKDFVNSQIKKVQALAENTSAENNASSKDNYEEDVDMQKHINTLKGILAEMKP